MYSRYSGSGEGRKEDYLRKIISRTDVLVNDIGSILNGYEAVECGLIDEVGGIGDALSFLKAEADNENRKKNDKENRRDSD